MRVVSNWWRLLSEAIHDKLCLPEGMYKVVDCSCVDHGDFCDRSTFTSWSQTPHLNIIAPTPFLAVNFSPVRLRSALMPANRWGMKIVYTARHTWRKSPGKKQEIIIHSPVLNSRGTRVTYCPGTSVRNYITFLKSMSNALTMDLIGNNFSVMV